MTEEEIRNLISKAYRKGLRDGQNGKSWPTYGELDMILEEIYNQSAKTSERMQRSADKRM